LVWSSVARTNRSSLRTRRSGGAPSCAPRCSRRRRDAVPRSRLSRPGAEGGQHPGAVLALLQLAGRRIAVGEERRREMEGELVVALELRAELLQEVAVGVEPAPPRTRPCRPSACRATWRPPRRGPSGPALGLLRRGDPDRRRPR
jgi:hypothetical protein